MNKGIKSTENLNHFKCHHCAKWWTIGDAPSNKKLWFCPWCGEPQGFKSVKKVIK